MPPALATGRGFGVVDVLVLIAYLGLLAGIAWRVRRGRAASNEEYFLAGHRIPWWAAGASLLATAVSAATILSMPEKGFTSGLIPLGLTLGSVLAGVLVALVFIPAFYRQRVGTVYGLLQHRFGRGAAVAAAWTFLIGRVIASGARLYLAGLAVRLLLFPDQGPLVVAAAVVVLAGVGLGVSYLGGIRAVIWTDVAQAGVFLLAALSTIVVVLVELGVGPGEIISRWSGGGQLAPFSGWFNGFADKDSLLAVIFGWTLINAGAYGCDQDLTQRALTCRDGRAGGRSLVAGVLAGAVCTGLFTLVGMLLALYYAEAGIVLDEGAKAAFPQFVRNVVPPGVGGLVVAGLAAAAVSGLTSEVNALAAVFVTDACPGLARDRDEAGRRRLNHLSVIGAACALAAVGVASIAWHRWQGEALLYFVMAALVFAYAGLLGVYLCALLTRRGNQTSAIAGLVIGFVLVCLGRFVPGLAAQVAFPWQMAIATTVAAVVCALGSPSAVAEDAR